MAHLERRAVVSALLFPVQFDRKPYRVLLFRRSEKVSTYRRKLAPIAGSIEKSDKSPLDAVWRELGEETGLGPRQIELWRRGPPFTFTDEKALATGERRGRIWTVWPFAFRFKTDDPVDADNQIDTSRMNIDWEHLDCEWTAVEDLVGGRILGDCVPRLEITLGRVWVDPESTLFQALEELRLDHTHGARELATMAVKSLIRIVQDDQDQNVPPKDMRQWWKNFRLQAYHLAFNARPSMAAAISSAVVTGLGDAKGLVTAGGDVLANVKQSLELYVDQRTKISQQVSDRFSMFLQDKFAQHGSPIKILTLSLSSTIKAAVLHALDADPHLQMDLRILESRPLFEGVKFAQALTEQVRARQTSKPIHDRLRIVVSTDASAAVLGRNADLVVIGADRISERGDVSNKTGSLPAVLACKHVTDGKVQTVCIAEAEKIAPPGSVEEHAEEDNDKTEVTDVWPSNRPSGVDDITVRNVYFEWVPARYIDHYVCEEGVLSTEDIKNKSVQISELTTDLFSDLQEC